MKKEEFEIYVPVHLRKLYYEIKALRERVGLKSQDSVLQKLKNIFEQK
jgi:hypothetical protein